MVSQDRELCMHEEVKTIITKQGTPQVNNVDLLTPFDGTQKAVIVSIDMKTKHTDCFSYEYDQEHKAPSYHICGKDFLEGDEFDTTVIVFPTLKQYQIVAQSNGRYSHIVCFLKVLEE